MHQQHPQTHSNHIHVMPHSMANIPISNQQVPVKYVKDYSYSLSDKLGLGMTANVFKGKNDKTGKRVAIKVIELGSIDNLSQSLINEQIKTLEKIKHAQPPCQNLLRLEEVVRTKNNLYIVTQFCEGKDMGKILRQKKNLTEFQAQGVMKQLINGCRELNQLGLIHRDLKISNIFVTGGKIKLADFGFAIPQELCNVSMGYNVGTVHYMAPQALRFNKYSIKADIWSLGVIAYELVYGKAPYKQKVDSKLYDLMMNVPIQNLFDPSIQVSNEYKNFIYQCLQVDPQVRATPQQVFNYKWEMASNFIEGFEEEVKVPEVIKVPGMNYAVYRNSSKQISYESKQLDIVDFTVDPNRPTQTVIVGQLSYCIFLGNLYDLVKNMATHNPSLAPLVNEIAITIQTKIKKLSKQVRNDKNYYETNDLKVYTQTADWENLKQVIIRHDIEFRSQLKGQQPLSKFTQIPYTSTLQALISNMKFELPNNWRVLQKLMTYFEIREISRKVDQLSFSQAVNFNRLIKDMSLPDDAFNTQAKISSLNQRIQKAGL